MKRVFLPVGLGVLLLVLWESTIRLLEVPVFVLPAPSVIGVAFADDFIGLSTAAGTTLLVMFQALLLAVLTGLVAAFLMSRSRLVEMTLFPYAVVLQVTPLVAITPLIIVWVGLDHADRAVLIIAWIVAFFPILSNMVLGLRSVDPALRDYFRVIEASPWQVFCRLELPWSLPYFLTGLKVSAGLALIGAVVAEFLASSGSSQGLAWTIMESGNRLEMPRMFAALLLLSFMGVAIFYLVSGLEYLLLRRWHDSFAKRR